MSVKSMIFGGDSENSLKNKYSSRAVSPVIGVILMVVITVILAGVISVAVLDFGGDVNEGAPQASIDGDFDSAGLIATHNGGDSMDGNNIKVFVDGTDKTADANIPADYTVGSQIEFTNDADGDGTAEAWTGGEEVRIVYDDGQGNTATLYTGEAPA